jgi:hypothetical protein
MPSSEDPHPLRSAIRSTEAMRRASSCIPPQHRLQDLQLRRRRLSPMTTSLSHWRFHATATATGGFVVMGGTG